jgi:hypothetical protein
MLFMRSAKFGGCFFGGLVWNAEGPSYPDFSSSPPYPPGVLGCGGGGELFAICGEKKSSALLASGRPTGVWGDMLLCEPLDMLMGVSWPWLMNARSGLWSACVLE